MAISSMDQILAANAAGQCFKYVWCKQNNAGALTAGKWANTATWVGNPTAMNYTAGPVLSGSFPGSQLVADQSPYLVGTIPTGGPVAPYTKYLVGIEANTTVATGVPSWLMLVDMLAYYPGLSMNVATAQTLNSVALPRYSNGAGVQMFMEDIVATSTTVSTLSTTQFLYTNSTNSPNYQSGGGLTIPWAVQVGTVASTATTLVHSGITANNAAPFIPLAAGDLGVQSVQQVQLSAGTGAGSAALILCKPLAQVPLAQGLYSSGRDFVFNMPTLPIVYDGACLAFLLYTGAATALSATFHATLDFVWG